ncbi:MAG: methyltransferase domain-containing protein [Deltaproteobacteria bacterium]
MRIAAVLILAACSSAPAVRAPAPPPDVKQMSHALIDAFDRGDAKAFEAALSPGFVHAEEGDPSDRAQEVAKLAKYDPKKPHVVERTWTNEHVFAKGDEAVFIGQASEHDSGGRGGRVYDGRYTLAWHWDGRAWKLGLWTWQRAGSSAETDSWNDVFKHGTGFEKAPNQLLVKTAGQLPRGTALDILSGQGRNVLYLASAGWKVTGIDFSHEGIEQTRDAARAKHVDVELIEDDIEKADLGSAKYDLVTMIYAGSDAKTVAKAQQALKPGGTFVCEYFAATDGGGSKGWQGFHRGELAKLFANGYEIVRDEVVEDSPDWGGGKEPLVRFVARKR